MAEIAQFLKLLADRQLGTPQTIQGCTDEEIEALRACRGGYLPRAYEEFLRAAGRRAGNFWLGSTAFYPEVTDLEDADLERLVEGTEMTLPTQNRLIFLTHQGYEYLWLDVSIPNDDPPVWQLVEGEPSTPRRIFGTFTALLLSEADGPIR